MHIPVMLREVCENWLSSANGIYIDCTFGCGGHSKEFLKSLGVNSRLIGMDVDPKVIPYAEELSSQDSRFSFLNVNYTSMRNYWKTNSLPPADGILFDLGLSTLQLKDEERTFSYNSSSSTLELRFGLEGKSVYEILNNYPPKKLNWIFKKYGNISEAERLTQTIIQFRKNTPITEVNQLKEIIERSKILNKRKNKNPMKLIFQSLRIECNNELNCFKEALRQAAELLKVNGKLLIITFQSLEDEIVLEWKRQNSSYIKIPEMGEIIPPRFTLKSNSPLLPSRAEIETNWASRSAELWVFTKTRE
ncbi:16S rRNA (cytosine(1402)-N(4))-methyltransferase RsmH [Mycoplasma suis]|uniref:Ribosomal RNA small subunit methyltransferase H n=1 Tax=Mycoplasma suis (strain Illinois) TaxID=768700 RepID=F0QR26_MYCSL|nr:16S rRNA (cytosine(1402)-N(4))-methyltransferase RsmH [Mycoplasma suis]ADX97946.1 s-adenosyl-methyltransferase MraW [Mycoplasma suis str. Illinois]